jgi:AcrR family transcriptional regulator
MSTSTEGPKLRADARRNREAILDAAGRLFAANGHAVQMDEIADRSGLGMGTVYRHFPTKRALVAAIVARRLGVMTESARDAAALPDAATAFHALLLGYLESAAGDAAYRWSVLGPEAVDWDEVDEAKQQFRNLAIAIIARAVEARCIRPDFTFRDFVLITRAVMANMSNTTPGNWQRSLSLIEPGIGSANALTS